MDSDKGLPNIFSDMAIFPARTFLRGPKRISNRDPNAQLAAAVIILAVQDLLAPCPVKKASRTNVLTRIKWLDARRSAFRFCFGTYDNWRGFWCNMAQIDERWLQDKTKEALQSTIKERKEEAVTVAKEENELYEELNKRKEMKHEHRTKSRKNRHILRKAKRVVGAKPAAAGEPTSKT